MGDTLPIEYTGFWARFAAFLIDSVAVMIVLTPLLGLVFGSNSLLDYNMSEPADRAQFLSSSLSQTLIVAVIFLAFWGLKSATPGKMLMKCSIVDATTLQKTSTLQNIIRYLGYFVSLVPLGAGFIWVGIDSRKQGWHDKMARTLVIRGKPRDAAERDGPETDP